MIKKREKIEISSNVITFKIFFLVFETESFYVVLTLLGSSMYVRLSEDSQISTYLSLSNTRLRGVEHLAVSKSFPQRENVLFYMILLF